jgi:hypothetical protein
MYLLYCQYMNVVFVKKKKKEEQQMTMSPSILVICVALFLVCPH